jgi:hypothetical protein
MNFRHCLTIILAVLASPALAQDKEPVSDPEIAGIAARHSEARRRLLRARLSLYADELAALRSSLSAGNRRKDAEAVSLELARVLQLLKAQPEPEPPEGLPRGPSLEERLEAFAASLHPEELLEGTASEGVAPPGQARARLLKIEKANIRRQLLPYGAPGPNRSYWSNRDATAAWTISGISPGDYVIVLRYQCGPDGGGTALITAGREKVPLVIEPGDSWNRRLVTQTGTIRVPGPGLDLSIAVESLAAGSQGSLWDLRSVLLQPVPAATAR